MASQSAVPEKTNDVKAKTDRDAKTSSLKDVNVLLHTRITLYIENKYILSINI